MEFTESERKLIIEIGASMIGRIYPEGYKCHYFVRDIYMQAGVSTNFNDYPNFSYDDIYGEKAICYPLFLRRKETKVAKLITHMGIIFPGHKILHCSRWMRKERVYEVFLSSFLEVFEIYSFVV